MLHRLLSLMIISTAVSRAFGFSSAPCLKNPVGVRTCSLLPRTKNKLALHNGVLHKVVPMRASAREDANSNEREGGGAGVAVITKPDLNKATQVEVKKKVEWEGNWRVLLHRDEWYTFDYCEGALLHVIPVLTRKKAHRITMQAHMKGIAVVISVPWKQLAREYCLGLLSLGFTSSISPDRTNSC